MAEQMPRVADAEVLRHDAAEVRRALRRRPLPVA
jgi:hypothetical protein